MKKLTALFVTVAFLLGLLCGCSTKQTEAPKDTESAYKVNYPKVSANWMIYSLTPKTVEELATAVEECKKIYNSANPTKKDDLLKSLYAAMDIFARIDTQLDIAEVKYECDYSDEKAKENYNEALELQKKANNIFLGFLTQYDETDNPLSDVRKEFKNNCFPDTLPVTGDDDGWWPTAQQIANKINSINSTATDEGIR